MTDLKRKIKNNVGFQRDTIVLLERFLQRPRSLSKLVNLFLNTARKFLKKFPISTSDVREIATEITRYECVNANMQPLSDLYGIIDRPEITLVSFDVFDTLLCRPCISPDDIFRLVAKAVDEKYHIDFYSARKKVEKENYGKEVDINVLYGCLCRQLGINNEIAMEIKETEVDVEAKLLFPREEIKKVYEYAVQKGKRIIAVSDMYLTSEILERILKEKGYEDISAIYVSCEYGKNKYNGGELFAEVLKLEGVSASSMLHVGDNPVADYENPLKNGIVAFYYPSVLSQIYSNNTLYKRLFPDAGFDEFTLGCRILYGFTLNYFGARILENKTPRLYENPYDFGQLCLAPVLVASMMNVLNNQEIQQNYNTVYFASRDGYLPQKVYKILQSNFGYGILGKYFYAGRRLYYSAMVKSPKDFCNVRVEEPDNLTIKAFLETFVFDDDIRNRILEKLTDENCKIRRSDQKWNSVCSLFYDEIEEFLEESRKGLFLYYRRVFDSREKRHLVFDCGHSGSISVALGNIVQNEKFDKLYMMQTEENKKRDRKNKTKTFSLLKDVDNVSKTHLFEECFSPYDDAPMFIDFAGAVHMSNVTCSVEMKDTLTQIQKGVEDFAAKFASLFRHFARLLYFDEAKLMSNKMNEAIHCSPYSEVVSMLNDIRFHDRFSNNKSLGYKISGAENYPNFFMGSGFVNPDNYIMLCRPEHEEEISSLSLRVCVHVHLYYIDLLSEFLYYLRRFPVCFDLVVTTPKRQYESIVRAEVESTCANLKELYFICCENVGRDVAPWIVEMGKLQDSYDFVCHVHTKKTEYLHEIGTKWRVHLLSNLLSPVKVKSILHTFSNHPSLGCLSPAPFKDHVYAIWNSTWLFGKTKDELESLLARMNLTPEMQRDKLLYSIGTMFWYRPQALKPLFDLKLDYADFPVEPLNEEGSIAHAIEHIINYVCIATSYEQKLFLPNDIDSSPFSKLVNL